MTDAMRSISAVVGENTAAEEMWAQAAHAASSIQSIAAVSEEHSAATAEVSASAEEMSAQAKGLATTAEQLQTVVARFTLERGARVEDPKIVPMRRAA